MRLPQAAVYARPLFEGAAQNPSRALPSADVYAGGAADIPSSRCRCQAPASRRAVSPCRRARSVRASRSISRLSCRPLSREKRGIRQKAAPRRGENARWRRRPRGTRRRARRYACRSARYRRKAESPPSAAPSARRRRRGIFPVREAVNRIYIRPRTLGGALLSMRRRRAPARCGRRCLPPPAEACAPYIPSFSSSSSQLSFSRRSMRPTRDHMVTSEVPP